MKCNQCQMLQISTGGISLPTHETGCPNARKVWDEEEQEWVVPKPETDEDDLIWEEEDDDEEFAEDMAEQVGAIDRDAKWPMNCIDWEQAAKELMMDYMEHNGYYFRSL